ncbi:hypothetical protein [Fibrobacter sp.]|uniref:hypothetical protein n=1 Tax=Fibrobacter sp. TaxID=35828 RepID=UPI001B1F28A4|nr:hypothetical protein [Fibrobacter sp.]MBO7060671.1 hypothetical protein [Fibrobacter sp.]MBO7104029.1 hypothetical protein [Fibrobacter sp.]MBR3669341.1 hypothetical protein [Fibrobacter sp.]
MAGLPPLRYLRKTTIIVIVVFLAFLAHRVVTSLMENEVVQDVAESELSLVQSVICRHIVSGSPFGQDSVFEENIRLYFYTAIPNIKDYKDDTLLTVWFRGLDTVQTVPCSLTGDVCFSMIAPSLLQPGEWSVDLVDKQRLLSSRQFRIEPADR